MARRKTRAQTKTPRGKPPGRTAAKESKTAGRGKKAGASKSARTEEPRATRKTGRAEPPESEVGLRLSERGIQVGEATLQRMLARAVDTLPRTLYPESTASDLTEAEVATLERGGFEPDAKPLGSDEPLARTTAEFAALLATSRTVAESARTLGVEESRIRQRLSAPQSLYGFKLDGRWRIPAFQFDGEALVPGIVEVIPHLRAGLAPVTVHRWFTLPSPDLLDPDAEGDEDAISPREWLRKGRSPEPVAEIAGQL